MAEIVVEFDRSTQNLGALREAAYRLIAEASCHIEAFGDRFVCQLVAKEASSHAFAEERLRTRFLDLVTDENLREKVGKETRRVRDVILALAFGALAKEQDGGPAT